MPGHVAEQSVDQEGPQRLEEVAGEQRGAIRCGAGLGAEDRAGEGDGGERHTVVVVVAGAVAADEQLRLALRGRPAAGVARGSQRQSGISQVLSVLSQIDGERIGCGEHVGIDRPPGIAVVGGPSGRHGHVEPISVRPDPPATPAKTTAPMEIPELGREMSRVPSSVVSVALTMPMPVIATITFSPPMCRDRSDARRRPRWGSGRVWCGRVWRRLRQETRTGSACASRAGRFERRRSHSSFSVGVRTGLHCGSNSRRAKASMPTSTARRRVCQACYLRRTDSRSR